MELLISNYINKMIAKQLADQQGSLGISIYPDKSTFEDDKAYIELAAKYGFTKIFTALLNVKPDNAEEMFARIKKIGAVAKANSMELMLDIGPQVFMMLNIAVDDVTFFTDLGATGIRLDIGFGPEKDAALTRNEKGISIEVNASFPNTIESIMECQPNIDNLVACHNYFPQKYTGLGEKLFEDCNKRIKRHGVKIAAFVCTKNEDNFGVWEVSEGLCTLEVSRQMSTDLQTRHLWAFGDIDQVIVGDTYATEAELLAMSKARPKVATMRIEVTESNSEIENEILFANYHVARNDMSDYMARSIVSRLMHSKNDFPANNTCNLKRGDVVICNNGYGQYKAELQLVLQEMENDGNKNVVARVIEEELFLLDYITPGKPFAFIK